MKNTIWGTGFGSIVLLGAVTAWAGGISEGGTDEVPSWNGSAWFLESGAIRTCVEVSPDFGYSKEAARQDIQSAFDVWDRYMKAKGIYRGINSDSKFVIVSSVDMLPSCDGTQELTIYLGVSNPDVESVKKRYQNPLAFVHRQNYDLDQARSKGFIWVAKAGSVLPEAKTPDWSRAYNFHGIMLHEIGHVMGVDHVKHTIMDDEWMISRLQSSDDAWRKVSFTKVDYVKELVPMPLRDLKFDGFFGSCRGRLGCSPNHAELFKTLVGRDPSGKIVRAKFTGGYDTSFIEIIDDLGNTKLKLERIPNEDPSYRNETGFDLNSKAFRVYRNVHENGMTSEGYSLGQSGSVEYFWVTSAKGQKYLALVERNSDVGTALDVSILTSKGLVRLFQTDYFQMPY